MTQDKAPEWAMKEARTMFYDRGDAVALSGGAPLVEVFIPIIALALSQAYERGQVDMRERAAKACDGIAGNSADFDQRYRRGAGNCSNAIRSLPIEQERKP